MVALFPPGGITLTCQVMFETRQNSVERDHDGGDVRRAAVALASDYAAGEGTGQHHHRRDQLVFAAAGVMRVFTPRGLWVVPPERAVWVPGGVSHELQMCGAVSLRTLYFTPSLALALAEPVVLAVSPLLREAVLRFASLSPAEAERGPASRLLQVVIDELQVTGTAPFSLSMPRDPRALRVARALLANPADVRTLAAWAALVGASERTLSRHFNQQTGVSFAAWRQQVRLLQALEWLAEGASVTRVALDLGYAGPSPFVAAFRRSLGTTPARYFGHSRHR